MTCTDCGKPAEMTFHGLCRDCMADSMDYDDDEFDEDEPSFECAGYYPEPAGEFYCPLWGTEECDWECTEGQRP